MYRPNDPQTGYWKSDDRNRQDRDDLFNQTRQGWEGRDRYERDWGRGETWRMDSQRDTGQDIYRQDPDRGYDVRRTQGGWDPNRQDMQRYGTYGGYQGGYGQHAGDVLGRTRLGQQNTFDPDRQGYRSPLESEGELRDTGMRRFGALYGEDRGLGIRRMAAFGSAVGDTHGGALRRMSRPPTRYTRSDDRIRDDVYDRLMGDTGVDASDIDVIVKNGEVTLSGTVKERNDKRIVEDLAECVLGVKDVHNQLRRVIEPNLGQHGERNRLPS